MPCQSCGTPSDDREARERLDTITRLACEYCKSLERAGKVVPTWAEKWWRQHIKEDAARRAFEIEERRQKGAKKAARAKLSPAERAALGIE
jgi:hypothetical protein